jgi:hypothetical protein
MSSPIPIDPGTTNLFVASLLAKSEWESKQNLAAKSSGFVRNNYDMNVSRAICRKGELTQSRRSPERQRPLVFGGLCLGAKERKRHS